MTLKDCKFISVGTKILHRARSVEPFYGMLRDLLISFLNKSFSTLGIIYHLKSQYAYN